MIEIMTWLQFAAFIPVAVFLIYKPKANGFFKLLLASIFLSILFDIIGYISATIYKDNILAICAYSLLNSVLITFMWQKVSIYSSTVKSFVKTTGVIFILAMILLFLYFGKSINSLYLILCLNVLLGFIFALQYYYQKITNSSYSPLMEDPYFVTATAYILMCLSTIIITASQIIFDGHEHLLATWTVRQLFYLIYNIIIAFAFFTLYKSQAVEK